MDEAKALTILKSAILLEKKGEAFYRGVAEHTKSELVTSFFSGMANDEKAHTEILEAQFKAYRENSRFSPDVDPKRYTTNLVENILGDKLRDEISSSGYEAAAISAAMSMEEAAVKLYSERAESSDDEEEKKLYKWLAEWERSHLNGLVSIDNELREKVWYDNHFWPM